MSAFNIVPARISRGADLTTPASSYFGFSASNTPAPIVEIKTGPTDIVRILNITLGLTPNGNGAAAQTIGLGVPAAAGIGLYSNSGLFENGWDNTLPPGLQTITEWTTYPTAPTNYLRRVSTSDRGNTSTVSTTNNVEFFFPRGYIMKPSTSLVVWYLTCGGGGVAIGFDLNVAVDA